MNYLYFNIDLKITINNVCFSTCNSIEINQSLDTLTNTAIINLPREYVNAFRLDDENKGVNLSRENILNHIKIGYPVKIEIGYNNDLKTEFEGYVSDIKQNIPLVIECEDEMYILKNLPPVSRTNNYNSLNNLLRSIIPANYDLEINEIYNIGKWIIQNATPYKVLEQLQELGFRAYFKTPKLLCIGLKIDFKPTKIHDFNFSRNVRVSSDIQLVTEKKEKLKVTINSIQRNGNKLSYSIGEDGGNTYTLDFKANQTIEDLKIYAESVYNSRLNGTLKGTLDSWGIPQTKVGDVANIIRPYYTDRHQDGKYIIEAVKITVDGSDGFKRQNTLSYKLND